MYLFIEKMYIEVKGDICKAARDEGKNCVGVKKTGEIL